MTTIAADNDAVRVPAGRDLAADQALTDVQIRAEQHALAKAASETAGPKAEKLGEVRDYLRDILRRRRLATDPDYRAKDEKRRRRILDDPDMLPWLKKLYLDTRIVDNNQLTELFGVGILQIWNLAAPEQKDRRPRPHPRMSPQPDVILNVVGGREGPGVQLGIAEEWWRKSNRGMWLARESEMVKNPERGRYGRPRRETPRQRPRGRQKKATNPAADQE